MELFFVVIRSIGSMRRKTSGKILFLFAKSFGGLSGVQPHDNFRLPISPRDEISHLPFPHFSLS